MATRQYLCVVDPMHRKQLVPSLLLLLLEGTWGEAHHSLTFTHFPGLIHQLHYFKVASNTLALARVHLAEFCILDVTRDELLASEILVKAHIPTVFQDAVRQVEHNKLLKRLTNNHLGLHSCFEWLM